MVIQRPPTRLYNDPVKRRFQLVLITATIVVFLALTIATVASFWRGYGGNLTRVEPTSTKNTKTENRFYLGSGGLFVLHDYNDSPGDFSWFKPKSPDVRFFATKPRYPDNDRLGFGWKQFSNTGSLGTHRTLGVVVPLWMVPVTLLVPLAWWFRRRRRQHAQGRCRVCGYDIRASPVQCPECGNPVEPAIAPAG